MAETERQDKKEEDASDPPESANWRDDALEWYRELKQNEHSIAPWLSLEWTGERMRIRRG